MLNNMSNHSVRGSMMTEETQQIETGFSPDVVQEAGLQEHVAQQQALVDIAKLINDVRLATSLSDFRTIQLHLGAQIAKVEAEVGHADERRSKSEKTLRRMRKRLTPP